MHSRAMVKPLNVDIVLIGSIICLSRSPIYLGEPRFEIGLYAASVPPGRPKVPAGQ